MAHRLKALLMLLVIGLALPTAAMPQRFCTISHQLLSGSSACAKCQKPSCCKNHKAPGEPGCVIVFKGLPDSVHSNAIALPAVTGVLLPDPFSLPEIPVAVHSAPDFPVSGRAPPGPVPLYLTQRSLLL